jgi:uncharacterized protein (TIGR03435 family)
MRLEAKKAIRRAKKVGNAHIFEAAISRTAAQRRLIDDLLSFFGGRTQPVMEHLIEMGHLTLERECDEEVIRQGSAPHVYAAGLQTCAFHVQSPLPGVAGVTGSDLKRRIEQIMGSDAGAILTVWRKTMGNLSAGGVTMSKFASALSRLAGRLVVDKTRLTAGSITSTTSTAGPVMRGSHEASAAKPKAAWWGLNQERRLRSREGFPQNRLRERTVMKHRFTLTAVALAVLGLVAFDIREESLLSAQGVAGPTFEVASIKPNKSGDGRVMLGFQPGGRFTATGVTLKMLIGQAYGVDQPLAPFQIVGGPDWIDRDRFDIVAKAEGDVAPGPNGPIPMMVRALLAERFKLVVHPESREMPVYALVRAKADGSPGPQLKPAVVDCAAMRGTRGGPPPLPPTAGERPPCAMRIAPGNLQGGGMSMVQLSNALARMPAVNRIVLDRTGLTGGYDFDLTWTPDQIPQLPAGGPPPGAPPFPPIDPNGPSLFAAVQEQLGLKLDSTRAPVNIVVVDAAEPPTED